MILRANKKFRKTRQSKRAFLATITHLHLQSKMINEICNLAICPNLQASRQAGSLLDCFGCSARLHYPFRRTSTPLSPSLPPPAHPTAPCPASHRLVQVLYLYDNLIETTTALKDAPRLTHLYMQQNRVEKLTHLPPSLCKLFADGNRIGELTGIEDLPRLQELSLAAQQLAPGQRELVVPRRVFESCAGSLVALNLSANGLATIPGPILGLPLLRRLALARNQLQSLSEVTHLVTELLELQSLDLRGNPVCRERRFRMAMITASQPTLQTLDNEPIHAEQREKLEALALHRENHGRRPHGTPRDHDPHEPSRRTNAPRRGGEAVSSSAVQFLHVRPAAMGLRGQSSNQEDRRQDTKSPRTSA